MKIAFFHELQVGGARRASNEFAKNLKRKHQIDLYFVDNKFDKSEEIFYSNVKFVKFIPKKWSGNNWKTRIYKDSVELINLRKLHKQIAQEIDNKKYDLVLIFPSKFTQAPFVLEYLKTKKIFYAMEPLRLVYEDKQAIPKDFKLSRKYYERINRFIRKRVDLRNIGYTDLLIAPSMYSANWSKKVYKKKIKVAYLGVKTSFFTPIKNPFREIDILFVGSMDAVTGYGFFTEIKKKLGSKIKTREVLFEKEWLTDVQIRDLYRKAKILVATSVNEPLGIIPLEAMSCGMVVLAVDDAGYRETVISGKNGFLLSKNDPEVFVKKINQLLENKYLFEKMSKYAIENMNKNWSWEKASEKLEGILVNY